MEQQGQSGPAAAAARTVLPGEPFEPPFEPTASTSASTPHPRTAPDTNAAFGAPAGYAPVPGQPAYGQPQFGQPGQEQVGQVPPGYPAGYQPGYGQHGFGQPQGAGMPLNQPGWPTTGADAAAGFPAQPAAHSGYPAPTAEWPAAPATSATQGAEQAPMTGMNPTGSPTGSEVPAGFAPHVDPLEALQQYASLPSAGSPWQAPMPGVPAQPEASGFAQQAPSASTAAGVAGVPASPAAAPSPYGYPVPAGYSGIDPITGLPVAPAQPATAGYGYGLDHPAPAAPAPAPEADASAAGVSELNPSEEAPAGRRGRRRSTRRQSSVDRRLLALGGIAVLAAGGFFGYTKVLNKPETSSTPPAPPAAASAAARYDWPQNLFTFQRLTDEPSTPAVADTQSWLEQRVPQLAKGKSTIAVYGNDSNPVVAVAAINPGTLGVDRAYQELLAAAAQPVDGAVANPPTEESAGAAGGEVTCGSLRGGATTQSWCVWKGTKTVGVLRVAGDNVNVADILLRELRAYAEH